MMKVVRHNALKNNCVCGYPSIIIAVYTRNRNFRLYLSSKLGKTAAVLRVAKESKFKSSYSESTTRRNWSRRFNTLMDSLICNIR